MGPQELCILAVAPDWDTILLNLAMAVIGAAAIWGVFSLRDRATRTAREAEAERAVAEARQKAEEIIRTAEVQAKKSYLEMQERFERETAETREDLKATERRLTKREDALDKKMDVLDTKERKIEDAETALKGREQEIEEKTGEIESVLSEQRTELLRVSRLTPEQAKELCLKRIEDEIQAEAGRMVERIITEAQDGAREKARYVVIQAIERYAAEHTCESTVSSIDVASDDMKGRVIGREGRNIRAFEKATGVTVIVDDTPGVVSVTATDPIRREVARVALDKLIRDGRIHPTRIEAVVQAATKDIEEKIIDAGQKAALETKVHGVPKKILDQLGRLHFRTSYGQNVLRHSVEVSCIAGMMADELRLDGALARRCGLLHDIGKGFPHDEGVGTHTKLGSDFCKRFNEDPAVINAIEGHHGDVASMTPYTPLVMAADAISASRPGARRESLERYIKRLEELEAVATGFPGVRQAHAVEAGREVRVIVDAEQMDDRSSVKLARDIAAKIEDTMTYPGEIRVTVLRELRAVEYAR
ncbi:MAG: ribonuclease Y [Phycisphaerae bacterium]|nr:ribonuclease Y [Phycisphaerae bacterium]